jgi:hypothetical protein
MLNEQMRSIKKELGLEKVCTPPLTTVYTKYYSVHTRHSTARTRSIDVQHILIPDANCHQALV